MFPKDVLKAKPEYSGVIKVTRSQNVGFQHIHANQILISLTLFDNIE